MRPRELSFIVNADDLGYSHEVNVAIEKCLAAGVITSSTIIANGPAFDEAVSIAKRYPGISYGAHLNATEFRPLSGAPLGQIMCDGEFDRAIRKVRLTRETIAAISVEFDTQIARIKNAGLSVSHIDSHHHIHTVRALFLTTIAAAWKHNVRYVRPTRNIFKKGEKVTPMLRTKKRIWNAALALTRTKRVQYFGSLSDFIHSDHSFPPGSQVEIITHPGGSAYYLFETGILFTRWWEHHCDTPNFETYLPGKVSNAKSLLA